MHVATIARCSIIPSLVTIALGAQRWEGTDNLVGGWNDLNIVDDESKWLKVPSPFFKPGDQQPYPILLNLSNPAVESEASILVLIAALRETRTVHSLVSMFDQAEHPERVHVGVVQQNDEGDEDVLEGFCKTLGTPLVLRKSYEHRSGLNKRQPGEDAWGQGRYTAQSFEDCKPASRVRVFRMDSSEAAGPVYARAQQRRLLQDGNDMEDFCLQLDAHAVFTRGWDSKLLKQFAATSNEYAVLTTYPTNAGTLLPNGEFPNTNNHWEMPHLCTAHLQGKGVVRNDQASAAANLERPLLGKLWAAGLSFSRCHAERDVPADPHLKQIFNGEEFSRGTRLWTNGYDFYTLSRPVVGVWYGNEKGGQGSWSGNGEEMAQSEERLSQLLCRGNAPAPEALKGFDLGHRRHFEDYVALTGVDPRNGVTKKTSCLVRAWTPWLKDAPAPYEPLPVPPALDDEPIQDTFLSQESLHRVEG
jgi:hypothetical protein